MSEEYLGKEKEKKQAQRREKWRHFVREKNRPGTPLHSGIQITNEDGAINSTFVVHKVKNEVSFQ